MQKKLILIGSVVAVVIVAAVLATAYYSGDTEQPIPVNSGTSISNPGVKQPNFANEEVLTNIGITSDQLGNLEQTLVHYLNSVGKTPGQISFDSLEKISVDKNAVTPIWTISFVIQLDGKDSYKAKMDYFSLEGIRLYLYNLDSPDLIYDSQNVGGSPDKL